MAAMNDGTPKRPLLDVSDPAVKAMVEAAERRGSVTFSALNVWLPSTGVSSRQIEDVLAMLEAKGIIVIEEDDDEATRRRRGSTSR